MDDKELQKKFDLVAAHLASLAVSQQKAEERQRDWDRRQRELDERQQRGVDRISRAERILLLAIRAGRRERKEWRERHAALIDAQMRTEAAMASSEASMKEMFAKLSKSQTDTDAKLSKSQANTEAALDRLSKSQVDTDAKLSKSQTNIDASFAMLTQAQANSDAKLAELAEAQATTQRNLDALINVVRTDRQEREERNREG